jgi:hypothetical protein
LCSKNSSLDVRRIQPTPKSSKITVEIGIWLHSYKNSFDLDLYTCLGPVCSVHIRCAARASGLACVSVRCAAARHERRAAVALQSGGHRRPARLAVRPAVGRARRRQIGRGAAGDGSFARRGGSLPARWPGRPAAPRPAPQASRRPAAPRGARRAPRLLGAGRCRAPCRPASRSPGVPLPGRPSTRASRRPTAPPGARHAPLLLGGPAAPPPRAACGAPRCCLARGDVWRPAAPRPTPPGRVSRSPGVPLPRRSAPRASLKLRGRGGKAAARKGGPGAAAVAQPPGATARAQ